MKMPAPTDAEGVRRIIGSIGYFAKFLPHLSSVAEPIRVTIPQNPWTWTPEAEEAYQKIKKMVFETPILRYYQRSKELLIECDASSKGLGAALMQDGQPIGYASRALRSTEQNYAQIEKECLAIVFSVERFHQYTFGRPITIHTDHKPLEIIVKKPLSRAPKRLQSMMLKLLNYDLEIKYVRGISLHIPDMLSRAYLPTPGSESDRFLVNTVGELAISSDRIAEFTKENERDPQMIALKGAIANGWPDRKEELPDHKKTFHPYTDELAVYDGLVFRGMTVVVPRTLRRCVIDNLRRSHLGIDSLIRRAKELVYWPSMRNDLAEAVINCEACQVIQQSNRREPMMSIETNTPSQCIGVDPCQWEGKDFLITVDYFSGFWEIDYLTTTTTGAIVKKLKRHFARYGIPLRLVTDSDPRFLSREFVDFIKGCDIEHNTSSPHHLQGNGKAENAVNSAKKMLSKCLLDGTDHMEALMEIRNTPQQGIGTSSALRMFGRRCRTMVPTPTALLQSRVTQADNQQVESQKRKQVESYNQYKARARPLDTGSSVMMKPFNTGGKQ